ncbi:MAG TPA: heme-binding domain-containing protein [Chloroflexota bacterium]
MSVASPPTAATSRAGRTRRTLGLLWLIFSRELRLTWLLFVKEVRELLVSRALWAMVLISAPLVGFTFIQAVRLYSQNSASALKLPQLAVNQNPLDGIVIPVFGAVYLMNTFLFPFVAIRAIGNEKQSGALKLALQLPVGIYRVVGVKLAALFVGWSIALLPTISALLIWSQLLGGHLYGPELVSVFLGHFLYALVIAGVAFLAAALTESSATAAIVALAFTLASWILEFAGNVGTGLVRAVSAFSLSPALRGLEQGLIGSPTAVALGVLAFGFLALTVVWLPPGVTRREKLLRTGAVVGVAFQALLLAIQLPIYTDVTENRRNSFNTADVRALSHMPKELKIDVNLATNDSRFLDLQRNVLTKLQRTAPHVTINYAETSTSSLLGGTSGANYGTVTYTYGGKQGTSRATSAREVLPLIEALDGQTVVPDPLPPYAGFPLVTSAEGASVWFYAILPLLAVAGWWYFQQPPEVPGSVRVARVQLRSRWPWLAPYLPALRRTALLVGAGFVAIQFVPYGRGHTNVSLSPAPPTGAAAAQWCPTTFAPGTESSMTLGAFRQQVGGMQSTLDGALGALASGNYSAAVGQYAQLTASYSGVQKELAELYPIRCPRLLADRILGDSALLGPRVDPATAELALTALRSGIVGIGADIDQRINQASPNGLVGNQDEATADAPTVTGTPAWNTQQTQDLATRACAACHSNTPGWSWYSNIAPLSWAVQHELDSGRDALNLSEWDRPQPNAALAASRVQDGSMPPAWAGLVDTRMQLSDAERVQLVSGLQASFNSVPSASSSTPAPEARSGPNLVVLGAIGIVLLVLALALAAGPRQVHPLEQFSARRNP